MCAVVWSKGGVVETRFQERNVGGLTELDTSLRREFSSRWTSDVTSSINDNSSLHHQISSRAVRNMDFEVFYTHAE